MTYTGPPLTRPQLKALASIVRRGDVLEVHPAREEALFTRGLIDRVEGGTRAWLTDDGQQVLTDHQATRARPVKDTCPHGPTCDPSEELAGDAYTHGPDGPTALVCLAHQNDTERSAS